MIKKCCELMSPDRVTPARFADGYTLNFLSGERLFIVHCPWCGKKIEDETESIFKTVLEADRAGEWPPPSGQKYTVRASPDSIEMTERIEALEKRVGDLETTVKSIPLSAFLG